jgi:acetamidase/formamidase
VFATLFEKAAGVGPCVPDAGEVMSGEFITIECYDVIEGSYPTDERVRDSSGLLITGSGKRNPTAAR